MSGREFEFLDPLAHQESGLGVVVGPRVSDSARLSEQVESLFALPPLLEDHREQVGPLGFVGKVSDEIVAESFRVVDMSVKEPVEDVVCPVVELVA